MSRRMRVGGAAMVVPALLLSSLSSPGAMAQDASAPAASPTTGQPAPSPAPASPAWTGTALPGARAITATADRFVAVGSDDTFPGRAQAWTSSDGVEWTPAAVTDAPEGSTMTALTTTADGLVAVGTSTSEGAGGPDRFAAWSSTDGQTWEQATVRRSGRQGLSAAVSGLADGPGGTIALAGFFGQDAPTPRLYRSSDGSAWEPIRVPGLDDVIFSTLTAIPDGYLLIGNTFRGRPATFRSNDGETWQRVEDAPRVLLDAATGVDGTIVGITDQRVLATTDLHTWDRVATAPDIEPHPDTQPLQWVEWDGQRFGVTSMSHEGCPENVDDCYQSWLLVSPDGTTWTESTGPDGVPGPDEATQMLAIASRGETTVVLGFVGASPVTMWLTES